MSRYLVVEVSEAGGARLSDRNLTKEEAERRAKERGVLAKKYRLPFVYRVKVAA